MADNQYWIAVQKKAFVRWCNELLKKRNLTINDIEVDLKDGTLLTQLLEILSSKSIKHNRAPRMEVQRLENLTVDINFIKNECKIHIVNIGPNDVHDGNLKLILGLVWALILHFKIKAGGSGDDGSANKELLAWVNAQIPTYHIKNFTSDWQNGKAICALAEALRHGQMNLPQDFKNDPIADCTMGVKNAKENMNIPPVMDVEDIVHHPEQHSMMTYISYFREYDNAREHQKEKDLEMTPDISKCIVYGPGLEAGNDAGKQTYFTIEVRNAADRKVPSGGHNIFVRITGPHTQSGFNAADNSDGTYYVTYTPNEDGNYVVEVGLDNKPIQSSPFHVAINSVKGPVTTEPEPHWFVKDLNSKTWTPYDRDINHEIESQFLAYGGGSIQIMNNTFKIDLSAREEINTTKKHLFGHEKRPVCRGTWFWKTDDGNWCPYSEEVCVILEKAFKDNNFSGGNKVDISEKKKIRYVVFEDGQYKQYRQSNDANPQGRLVQRGYLGHTIEKEIPKKK